MSEAASEPGLSYLTLLMANNIESKKIATDSNCLRCHTLLTALHFPLENTCSCKQDRKERYWGQKSWQMERDISVWPTEMTRPVTVDHLESWSRIFPSEETEMVRSIWWTNRNSRTFGLNGKRPTFQWAHICPSLSKWIMKLTCTRFAGSDLTIFVRHVR